MQVTVLTARPVKDLPTLKRNSGTLIPPPGPIL
jgi:hypothetical protein